MKRVYMDNAATTRMKDAVLHAMVPFMTETFGNPSSVHSFGREARKAVEAARGQVAEAIGAEKHEIYFTGGGTEADNWIVKSAAFSNKQNRKHVITSSIEHHAMLHTCEWIERQGHPVTYLPVDADGIVQPKTLQNAITDDTALVSIMLANNEIGCIQPIEELAGIAHTHGALFHTDAVQAVGSIPVNVRALGVDSLSLSAHKFYGPRGVGALYVKKGIPLEPIQWGGSQERKKRGGTENAAGIVGLREAITLAVDSMDEQMERLTALRDRLIDGIIERIPDVRLNGHRTRRLPGNVNISIQYVEGEALLLSLDLAGIAASSGSACTSGSLDPSHVLLAIGLSHEIAHGSLRLSLGAFNTDEDVDYVLEQLPIITDRLRAMSPLFQQTKGGVTFV
jgi:cysteine desulfurase